MTTRQQRPLTGRMVLAIALGAFGVILAANLALLVSALGSFPGLEVKNSYVASQSFERDRAAQQALGWKAEIAYAPGRLKLALSDARGRPVAPAAVSGIVGRTTHQADDQVLAFAPVTGGYDAPLRLEPGYWHVRLEAVAQDGTRFRQRLSLLVRGTE